MAISIRLLQPHEVELANNFFNSIYQTNRPIENFKWEFLDGPNGKAIYIIAIDDEVSTQTKIVGIQCAIPLEFIGANGQIVLTAKSEDTLVDPSYRGQKIFERMYQLLFDECSKAGIKYIWGFTPAQKAFERIGFETPFKSEQALLVFKPFRAFSYLKKLNAENSTTDRLKILLLCFLSWIIHFRYLFNKKVVPVKSATMQMNDLFTKFYSQITLFGLNQSAAYMKWRMNDNPFQNKYETYEYRAANETKASVIVNFRQDVGYIEQILAKDNETVNPLLNGLVKKFSLEKAPLIRALCFSSNSTLNTQKNSLSQAGFTLLARGNFFVWKSLTQENLIQPNQLLITRLFTQGNV